MMIDDEREYMNKIIMHEDSRGGLERTSSGERQNKLARRPGGRSFSHSQAYFYELLRQSNFVKNTCGYRWYKDLPLIYLVNVNFR